jgi:hypothetical protein
MPFAFTARGPLAIPAAGGNEPFAADGTFEFWFDAQNAGSITKDGSDLVSQWSDLSGNGRHLVQATGANQPTWNTSHINGFEAIQFLASGSAKKLATSTWTLAQPFLVMIVIRPTSDTATPAYPCLWTGDKDTFGSVTFVPALASASDNAVCGAGTDMNVGTFLAADTNYWWYGGFDGASSVTRIIGQSEVGPTNAGAGTITDGISLGETSDGNARINIAIGEIFCISGYTSGDKAAAISYVASHWSL